MKLINKIIDKYLIEKLKQNIINSFYDCRIDIIIKETKKTLEIYYNYKDLNKKLVNNKYLTFIEKENILQLLIDQKLLEKLKKEFLEKENNK